MQAISFLLNTDTESLYRKMHICKKSSIIFGFKLIDGCTSADLPSIRRHDMAIAAMRLLNILISMKKHMSWYPYLPLPFEMILIFLRYHICLNRYFNGLTNDYFKKKVNISATCSSWCIKTKDVSASNENTQVSLRRRSFLNESPLKNKASSRDSKRMAILDNIRSYRCLLGWQEQVRLPIVNITEVSDFSSSEALNPGTTEIYDLLENVSLISVNEMQHITLEKRNCEWTAHAYAQSQWRAINK